MRMVCVYIICIIEPCLAQYCPVPENFVGLLVCFEIFEFEFLNFDLPRAMVQSFEPKSSSSCSWPAFIAIRLVYKIYHISIYHVYV